MSPVGCCALCRQQSDLQDSHLLPQFVYKILRGKGEATNPIIIDNGAAVEKSEQITKSLLCSQCESLLQKNETLVARLSYNDRSFKLLESLAESGLRRFRDGEAEYFSLDKETADVLSFFALGVLWRFSVVRWRSRSSDKPIHLGRYQEPLRSYLLGKCDLPQSFAVHVRLIKNAKDHILAGCPARSRSGQMAKYDFMIPGAHFFVFVGSAISPDVAAAALSGPDRIISVLPFEATRVLESIRRQVLKAIPKGKLSRKRRRG